MSTSISESKCHCHRCRMRHLDSEDSAFEGDRAVLAWLGLKAPASAQLLGAPAFHVVELGRGPRLRVFHSSAWPRPWLR